MSCPSLEMWLEALDQGRTAPDGGHSDCATCGMTRAQARDLMDALFAAPPPSPLGDDEFVARVLGALPEASPRPAPLRGMLTWMAPMAAAAILLFLLATRPPARDDGPVARGTRDSPAKWCELALARSEGLQFVADGAHVPAGVPLAFRVRHDAGKAWLGIFAITERGQVAWYYPAYESAAADPVTMRLIAAPGARLLPQRVTLPLGEGRVRVVCWKADRPWRVRKADALVEGVARENAERHWDGRVPSLGGSQQSIELWFEAGR
jgi:hypothetical protein